MASSVPADRVLTVEDYAQLPDDPAYRDELSRGRLVREPRPSLEHGRVQLRLGARLVSYVEEHALGYVVTEAGFILARKPDTLRGPDLAFVNKSRYESLPQGFSDIAPDLAVEVVSPGTRMPDLLEKISQYLAAGTRMVWIINPYRRTAAIYSTTDVVDVIGEEGELAGGDVVPGFTCRLRDLLDPL